MRFPRTRQNWRHSRLPEFPLPHDPPVPDYSPGLVNTCSAYVNRLAEVTPHISGNAVRMWMSCAILCCENHCELQKLAEGSITRNATPGKGQTLTLFTISLPWPSSRGKGPLQSLQCTLASRLLLKSTCEAPNKEPFFRVIPKHSLGLHAPWEPLRGSKGSWGSRLILTS